MNSDICADIFRPYDIRGVVGECLTEDNVRLIGQAFASVALESGESTVVVARDGRTSSPRLSKALVDGILSTGCNVIDIGRQPTPLLSYATLKLQTASGVMVTGSHNPVNYNGLKLTLQHQSLHGDALQQLYKKVIAGNFLSGSGDYQQQDITRQYIDEVCQNVTLKRALKVVVDSGNGVTGEIAPALLRRLGCEVIELYTTIDGDFPNHHPDPSRPENLKTLAEFVIENSADLGIAFDGDGDRIGVIDNRGKIIWPDRQMMLYATDILSRNPGATILYDVKSTMHLAAVISKAGGTPVMWRAGHSFLKSKMAESGALLAGEMSGHIFFKERWYGFDDALYSAARLLEITSGREESVADIFAALPDSCSTPEIHLPFEEGGQYRFMQAFRDVAEFENAEVSDIDGLRVSYPEGWGLIRASNTQPVVVFRFEADNVENLKLVQSRIQQQVSKVDDTLVLPF